MIARERRASVDAEMNAIPRIAGALAAVCMAGMVLLLLAELALRPFGVLVRSADDFTTFLMVAAAFLKEFVVQPMAGRKSFAPQLEVVHASQE